jgi:hypothetical protein
MNEYESKFVSDFRVCLKILNNNILRLFPGHTFKIADRITRYFHLEHAPNVTRAHPIEKFALLAIAPTEQVIPCYVSCGRAVDCSENSGCAHCNSHCDHFTRFLRAAGVPDAPRGYPVPTIGAAAVEDKEVVPDNEAVPAARTAARLTL